MSLPVLIGFAGVLVAAVATGLLAGRCVRQPRIGFIVWTAAILGLTIALAAQSMGFASGFGPATFRAVQLLALMLAPLWLAWGLVELAAGSDAGPGSGTSADGGRPGRAGRPHDRRAALPAPGQGGVSAAQHGGGGAGVVRSQQGGRAAPAGGRRREGRGHAGSWRQVQEQARRRVLAR